jgi:hypothetical protein
VAQNFFGESYGTKFPQNCHSSSSLRSTTSSHASRKIFKSSKSHIMLLGLSQMLIGVSGSLIVFPQDDRLNVPDRGCGVGS